MARIIVLPDAKDLRHEIPESYLYAEHVTPEDFEDLHMATQISERLGQAIDEAEKPHGLRRRLNPA